MPLEMLLDPLPNMMDQTQIEGITIELQDLHIEVVFSNPDDLVVSSYHVARSSTSAESSVVAAPIGGNKEEDAPEMGIGKLFNSPTNEVYEVGRAGIHGRTISEPIGNPPLLQSSKVVPSRVTCNPYGQWYA